MTSPLESLLVNMLDRLQDAVDPEGVQLRKVAARELDLLRNPPEPERPAQTVPADAAAYVLSELSWAVGCMEGEKTATLAYEKLVKARDVLLVAFGASA